MLTMSVVLKCTGDIKKFIIVTLPYLEKYIFEHKNNITLYAPSELCDIVSVMFGELINIRKMDPFKPISDACAMDIQQYFATYYGYDYNFQLSKPLNYDKNRQLKYKDFICVFPKRRETDKIHNISAILFDGIYDMIRKQMPTFDICIIGNPFDKLSVKKEKCIDVDRFIDTLDYLKYCKLFICSESNWVTIAKLCNCRNIIVYHSQDTFVDTTYNPFKCNVFITDSLDSYEFVDHMKMICDNYKKI